MSKKNNQLDYEKSFQLHFVVSGKWRLIRLYLTVGNICLSIGVAHREIRWNSSNILRFDAGRIFTVLLVIIRQNLPNLNHSKKMGKRNRCHCWQWISFIDRCESLVIQILQLYISCRLPRWWTKMTLGHALPDIYTQNDYSCDSWYSC